MANSCIMVKRSEGEADVRNFTVVRSQWEKRF